MSLYLVTGGAGFIGSNIVEELVRSGERVRVLDNFSTGRRDNLAPFIDHIELVEGDLLDLATVRRAMEGVDYVLHQAALPSVQRSVEDPLTTHTNNTTGTLHLLLAARDAGVKRFIFASSSSVYGDTPTLPKEESMLPCPKSPYAASKLTGEYYCRTFTEVYGLETVCLRYFNVFGPRQDPASQYAAVIPLFITAMLEGRPPTVYGDGLQSRDFTYVANVVQANLSAVVAPWYSRTGVQHSLRQVLHTPGPHLCAERHIEHSGHSGICSTTSWGCTPLPGRHHRRPEGIRLSATG
jgi:UDP-glucose 4-epimerase